MKIKRILLVATVALSATFALSSCIKETFPKTGAITEGQLLTGETSAILDKLLPGINADMLGYCYSSDMHSDYGMFSMGVFNDYTTDTIVNMGDPRYNHFLNAMWGQGYGPTGTVSNYAWWRYYPQIKSCNQIIKIAGDDERYAKYRGIAKAYRAMFYLDLARMYEPMVAYAPRIPNYNDELFNRGVLGMTVPYVDETIDEQSAKTNPRLTREEMFTRILADLDDAKACLENYNRANSSEPNLAVIYGLYARTYLWLGMDGNDDGYNGALPAGKDAMQKAGEYARLAIATHGGSVMTEAEWTSVTNGFNTVVPSWMLSLIYSSDTVVSNLHNQPAHFSPELIESYAALFVFPGVPNIMYDKLIDGDFRKKIIKGPETTYAEFAQYTSMSSEEFDAVPPYTFFKYRPAGGNRTDNMAAAAISLPLMRVEEMYFIEMEAAYHTQGQDAAFRMLYDFMQTYRNPNFYAQETNILDEILFQKKVEFWAEGLTMFDMKRLNKGVYRKYDGSNFDERSQFNTTVGNGAQRVPWWNYCIPMSETDLNKGIKANNPNPDSGVSYES